AVHRDPKRGYCLCTPCILPVKFQEMTEMTYYLPSGPDPLRHGTVAFQTGSRVTAVRTGITTETFPRPAFAIRVIPASCDARSNGRHPGACLKRHGAAPQWIGPGREVKGHLGHL